MSAALRRPKASARAPVQDSRRETPALAPVAMPPDPFELLSELPPEEPSEELGLDPEVERLATSVGWEVSVSRQDDER
jgi:hypothetical protein